MNRFGRFVAFVCLFASSAFAQNTVAVSMHLKDANGNAVTSKAKICATLSDGANNPLANPRVLGSFAIITDKQVCATPDNTGLVSFNLIANDKIDPSGSMWNIYEMLNNQYVHGASYTFAAADLTENLDTKSPVTTAPVVTPPTGDGTYLRLDGGNTPTGNLNFGTFGLTVGAVTASGAINAGSGSLTAGAGTFSSVNGEQVVGNGTNTTIAAAFTAAGTTGSVKIPASFACTEPMNNTNGVAVTDLRKCSDPNTQKTLSLITTSYPEVNAPLGHDVGLRMRGPSDGYLEHLKAYTTTTDSIVIGANANVLIGTVSVGDSVRGVLQTGDSSLLMNLTYPSSGVCSAATCTGQVVIGFGTTNQETVNITWVDATHISFTATHTHAGTTDIEEVGSLFIRQRVIILDPTRVMSTQQTTAQMQWLDGSNDVIAWTPGNVADTWPLGASWTFAGPITCAGNASGGHPTAADCIIRDASSSAAFRVKNFAGTDNLTITDAGAAAFAGNVSALSGVMQSVFKSVTANPSSTGTFERLASADTIGWRNNANTADILQGKNSSDQPTWASQPMAAPPSVNYAPIDLTNQSANIASNNLISSTPAAGQYRVTASIIETTNDAVSSTLPAIQVTWTSNDTGSAATVSITATSTANTVGTAAQATWTGYVKAATALQYDTTGYASNTASAMKYAIHVRVEGPF